MGFEWFQRIYLQQAVNVLHAFDVVCGVNMKVLQRFGWRNRLDRLVNAVTRTHTHTGAHTDLHVKLQKDTSSWTGSGETAKRLSSWGLCFIHAHVWGTWLRKNTFYLLYPAALEHVVVCLASVEVLGYNWRLWWCFVIRCCTLLS